MYKLKKALYFEKKIDSYEKEYFRITSYGYKNLYYFVGHKCIYFNLDIKFRFSNPPPL